MVNDSDILRFGSLNLLNNPSHLRERIPALVQEVSERDIQVLCLQEVLRDDRLLVEEALFNAGFVSASYGEPVLNKHSGNFDGTAIFSKMVPTAYDFLSFEEIEQEIMVEKKPIPAVVARFELNGRSVHVLSCHFAWGSFSEAVRLRQASVISRYARSVKLADSTAVVLAAGDFNARETSSTIRFLHGEQENNLGESTMWVDAWKVHGKPENWVTSDPTYFWGGQTARGVGILNPDMIPKRRIDYILSFDWCYGSAGFPLSYDVFGDKRTGDVSELSDHFGIVSDIYVPAV